MTELIWDGKYKPGADGKLVKQGPLRVALPFQTVETVNESAQERQKGLDLFASGGESEWRNQLIWGDKKYVLPSLLAEFAGKVDLIYIDPPFNTGGDFSYTRDVPESGSEYQYSPNAIEQKAYRDTWGTGIDSYLQWLYETFVSLKELLSPNGGLFLHLDPNYSHYAKVVLDEVFGARRFQNEVIWQRTDSHNDALKRFGFIHDCILWFGNSDRPNYYPQQARTSLNAGGLKEYSLVQLPNGEVVPFDDETELEGRRFKLDDATWKGTKRRFPWRGCVPGPKREWRFATVEQMEAAYQRGELYLRNPDKGVLRCLKSYFDENEGLLLQDIWTDAGRMKGGSSYATEKPEALLERIITATTHEGDLVLDCFCGSGTTAAVAEKLGRRWITCDLGRFAIHTARKRLLGIENVKPFVVQNLGKYERQQWQAQEFGEDAEAKLRAYRKFILDLYKARELTGKAWLHGVKSGRMVHVGSVDSPISIGDVQQIAKEFRQSIGTGEDAPTGTGVDVLGWDFAFDLNETAKNTAREAGIDMRFVVIPREVLEKKAVEQGDIHFYELAALTVNTKVTKHKLEVELADFIMSLDDVPADVQAAVKHWSQWIDYWAVDYDYKGDTFHNQWQSYRTRKEPKLNLKTEHPYEAPGTYTVMVKVIDILGNDTTKTVKVVVK